MDSYHDCSPGDKAAGGGGADDLDALTSTVSSIEARNRLRRMRDGLTVALASQNGSSPQKTKMNNEQPEEADAIIQLVTAEVSKTLETWRDEVASEFAHLYVLVDELRFELAQVKNPSTNVKLEPLIEDSSESQPQEQLAEPLAAEMLALSLADERVRLAEQQKRANEAEQEVHRLASVKDEEIKKLREWIGKLESERQLDQPSISTGKPAADVISDAKLKPDQLSTFTGKPADDVITSAKLKHAPSFEELPFSGSSSQVPSSTASNTGAASQVTRSVTTPAICATARATTEPMVHVATVDNSQSSSGTQILNFSVAAPAGPSRGRGLAQSPTRHTFSQHMHNIQPGRPLHTGAPPRASASPRCPSPVRHSIPPQIAQHASLGSIQPQCSSRCLQPAFSAAQMMPFGQSPPCPIPQHMPPMNIRDTRGRPSLAGMPLMQPQVMPTHPKVTAPGRERCDAEPAIGELATVIV